MTSWQTIDFHGIVSLNKPLLELLERYLNEKEAQVVDQIFSLLPKSLEESDERKAKLSDALLSLEKLSYNVKATITEEVIDKINAILWNYTEILESSIAEIFIQLDQVTLERWHENLAFVIDSLKDILVKKLENLIWGIKRLDNLLWSFDIHLSEQKSVSYYRKKCLSFFQKKLDKSLFTTLDKIKNDLKTLYQKFQNRHEHYVKLLDEVKTDSEKFKEFAILQSLDSEIKRSFLKIFELLKLWELNRTIKALPSSDFTLALQNEVSLDKAVHIFSEYYKALKGNLFERSLSIKNNAADLKEDSPYKIFMIALSADALSETKFLNNAILHYREFLLRVDPDPYVRTRLGFSEWSSGPEPTQLKPLLNLGYDVEALIENYEKIELSLKTPVHEMFQIKEVNQEIEELLHELSHPLATHRQIRTHIEVVLEKLQTLNELGSLDIAIIPYFGEIFSKIMRLDWRYHVAQGIPLFHQLYHIHEGLLKPSNDRQHWVRLHKFKRDLNQIENWVRSKKIHGHQHDIDINMQDIKSYLQDFLASIQRNLSEEGMLKERKEEISFEISRQLLEYRYLFGQFFYQLRQNEVEGDFVRKQFLFVDQYFETVTLKLNELTNP